ncbi:MAG TPA: hypothetical protein VK616_03065 [Flavitalea sp.]|nr:hypothetical protein [Flavitalea sp.]
MKKINEQATRIFCRLLQKLNGQQHLKIQSDGFMPLTIERLEENILTPFGVATVYSLCHYYEQNGDAIRDPEMCFLVIDNRKNFNDYPAIEIYPQMYQQDNLGLFEESIRIENSQIKSYIKVWRYSHCSFANIWLRNIVQQGFLQ